MRMLNYVVVCAALVAGVCCAADKDEARQAKPPKGKKPNVVALMKPADALMQEAEETYVEGDSRKAIALYRQALETLWALEMENEAWAATSEFALVRSNKILCEARIDGIMLEEAQMFARTMTVTDTRELEKKRAERRKAAGIDPEVPAPVKLGVKGNNTERAEEAEAENPAPFAIDEELEQAKDMIQIDRFAEAERALNKVLRADPENRDARLLIAQSRLQQGRGSDALVALDDLLADDARDEAALLLAAGAYLATGAYSKSMDALDWLIAINPKRPEACINMALLLLEMSPADTTEAEQYYRAAVKRGAARVRDLERRLGIKQE